MASASLDGKHCLVTGGSRGLGLAMCKAFARAGAEVAFTYATSPTRADEAVAAIAACGAVPRAFQGSVADGDHVREVVSVLTREWGGIDVLVNNAGPTQILPVALLDEEDWDMVMNTNVKGAYLFSRAVLRTMIRARRGHILNVGTFATGRVVEAPIHYAAAKAALRGLTEALAHEVGRYDVRVNLLALGLLDSGLSQLLPQHRIDEYLAQCPLGRVASVDEVADMAVFIVSDENTFMTGASIVLDGGV